MKNAGYQAVRTANLSARQRWPGPFVKRPSAPIFSVALPILSITDAGSQLRHPFHSSSYQEFTMNKDQAKGRLEEAKGKVKEVAGNLVGNDDLELKGKIQKSGGKIQAAYGDLKEDIKDASKGK
ncbi:CsbD family protein [Dechloromonas denitrificans]|nr:CsbD family protein [Dechloromonas denitrificans]